MITTGAFVAAPVGGLLWAAGAFFLRVGFQWAFAKIKGHRFDAFDRLSLAGPSLYTGREVSSEDEQDMVGHPEASSVKGRFF